MIRRITAFLFSIALLTGVANAAQSTLVTPGSPLTMTQLATFLNNGFNTVATNYSGATPPAVCTGGTACLYQTWLDTSTSPRVLRIYDGTAWVPVGTLDTSAHVFSLVSAETPVTRSGGTDTLGDADRGALIRYTNASATAVALPQAGASSKFVAGWYIDVRASSTGTVTVTPTASTINGAASLTLPPGLSVRILSDGANYFTTQTLGTPTASVLGGVFSKAAVSSNWIRSLGSDGLFTASQPVIGDISGWGTGVATALGINIGSAGAPVLFNGAGGTPSSVTLTNGTGLPLASGISGFGTGVATALAVNVGTAGAPVINGGALGTPSSGTVTNLTGTASININGTVGATTPTTGAFTTLTAASLGNGGTKLSLQTAVSGSAFGSINNQNASTSLPAVPTGTTGAVLYNLDTTAAGYYNYVFGAAGQTIQARSNGTMASPTALASGDVIGNFAAQGYDGTNWSTQKALIQLVAAEAWTPSANGTFMRFYVTPTGSTTVALAMTINASGGVGIGTTSDPGIGMIYTNSASYMLRTKTSLTGGGTSNVPTLTSGPVTGNPTKWIPYDDNGTTRYIPAW